MTLAPPVSSEALALKQVVLPPIVLTEMLSAPRLETKVSRFIRRIPTSPPDKGGTGGSLVTRVDLLVQTLAGQGTSVM